MLTSNFHRLQILHEEVCFEWRSQTSSDETTPKPSTTDRPCTPRRGPDSSEVSPKTRLGPG